MTPEQYHELLLGLDRCLFVFYEASREMTEDDRHLEGEIAILRSQVLKAESGHPFPFVTTVSVASTMENRAGQTGRLSGERPRIEFENTPVVATPTPGLVPGDDDRAVISASPWLNPVPGVDTKNVASVCG